MDLRETKGLRGLSPRSLVFFSNVLGVFNPTTSDTDRRLPDGLLHHITVTVSGPYRTRWDMAYLKRKHVGAMPDREQDSCKWETSMVT